MPVVNGHNKDFRHLLSFDDSSRVYKQREIIPSDSTNNNRVLLITLVVF